MVQKRAKATPNLVQLEILSERVSVRLPDVKKYYPTYGANDSAKSIDVVGFRVNGYWQQANLHLRRAPAAGALRAHLLCRFAAFDSIGQKANELHCHNLQRLFN